MEENNYSEILHYKRGIHIINKFMKIFGDGKYCVEKEKQFLLSEYERISKTEIGLYDSNNFLFICCATLMGLNKESIENSSNNIDYKYNLNYEIPVYNVVGNKMIDMPEKKVPIHLKKTLEVFNQERIIQSEYDEWLSINRFNTLEGYKYNFLSNIRNSIMHSEYSFDIFGTYDFVIANIKNSNYTNFSAKIFVPKFYEFVKHYFSNDVFFGIMSNLFVFKLPEENICKIKDKDMLLEYITDKIIIKKINYNNKLRQDKIFEKLVKKDIELTKNIVDKYNITETEIVLNSDEINQVLMSIESYFGDEFYTFDEKKQFNTIVAALKYKLDPKSVFSSWIMHFYRCISLAKLGEYPSDEFYSLFAMQPSLQILKSYMLLYRLQNKKLSKFEIDYDLINSFEYDYNENDYSNYKDKLIKNNIIEEERKNKISYFMLVFRNSLCHGNIDVIFKENNDKTEQYFCFSDNYKNRSRSITISIDNLQKFLDSDSFLSKNLQDEKLNSKNSHR